MSNAVLLCALTQVHLDSAKAASERLPGFDHELRLAAVRRGGGLLGRASQALEPPKGVKVWSRACRQGWRGTAGSRLRGSGASQRYGYVKLGGAHGPAAEPAVLPGQSPLLPAWTLLPDAHVVMPRGTAGNHLGLWAFSEFRACEPPLIHPQSGSCLVSRRPMDVWRVPCMGGCSCRDAPACPGPGPAAPAGG